MEKIFKKHSFQVGFSFGITSAIITTLGLMIGLFSGTHSEIAVIGGVLTIAIADAFSDALGIHIAEESEKIHTHKEVWESTFYTFVAKFLFAIIFIFPILLLELATGIWVNIIIGLLLLAVLSFIIAEGSKKERLNVVAEHLVVAVVVIFFANCAGQLISRYFG
ncbi:MAG: hypothetical protein WCX17_03590 [Parcubacteria group bacterium]|jgi:VIT1/CCC1 family predicted Fe2+/Mn2+ transporter